MDPCPPEEILTLRPGRGGALSEFDQTVAGETVLALVSLADNAPMPALATRAGIVKKVAASDFGKKPGQEIIGLKGGDELTAARPLPTEAPDDAELVFITSDAPLLRFAAATVRAQGRTGSGMAGIRLSDGAHVVEFASPRHGSGQYGRHLVRRCWSEDDPAERVAAKGLRHRPRLDVRNRRRAHPLATSL